MNRSELSLNKTFKNKKNGIAVFLFVFSYLLSENRSAVFCTFCFRRWEVLCFSS